MTDVVLPFPRDPRKMLAALGIRPRVDLGQHFLTSERVLAGIADDAGLTPEDHVLEIGAGYGALTRVLAPRVRTVTAVELDERLARIIPSYCVPAANIHILRTDVLRLLAAPTPPVPDPYVVVANLPYQITSRVIRLLLEAVTPPLHSTLLVQREVAERMTAPTGERSLLSLAVQLGSTPRITRRVGSRHFTPPPRVESAVVRLADCRTSILARLTVPERRRLFQLARMAFAGRRKIIKNTLAAGLHVTVEAVERQLSAAGIDPYLRPQALPLDSWLILLRTFPDGSDAH